MDIVILPSRRLKGFERRSWRAKHMVNSNNIINNNIKIMTKLIVNIDNIINTINIMTKHMVNIIIQ